MNEPELSETAERLLDAAERLFGERGVAQASLREITKAAGANIAAANYHFGSKEGLLRAAFMRRMEPLNRERLRLLQQAEDEAGEDGPSVERILRCFIGPTVPMCRQHPEFMKFVGRMHSEPDQFQWELVREGALGELIAKLEILLSRRLPTVPMPDLWWGMIFTIGALIHAWTSWDQIEVMSGGLVRFDGDERLVERLVAFAAAGLQAPLVMEREP